MVVKSRLLAALVASLSAVSAQTFQRLGTCPTLGCILPPDQQDFLPGQQFDIRFEVHAPVNGSEAYSGGDRGFFLMSEAASIDKQMHTLDYDRALGDLLELDDAINATIAHLEALGILDDTLVVVSADHGHGFDVNGTLPVSESSGVHSLTDVPVYAMGPCQEAFGGTYYNVDVFYKMAACLGLGHPTNKTSSCH